MSFIIAIAMIASSQDCTARGYVMMTPQLAEAIQNFTTYAPLPDYPSSARAHHFTGSGMYLLHLRKDGTVERVDIVESTGHRELDEACVSAYKQWHFRQTFAAKARKVKIPVTFANP